ncbi:MAG: indolepyruvate ferredoxin oxidoreductase subunit alpha [Candidatus Sumerlaeia bacterium]
MKKNNIRVEKLLMGNEAIARGAYEYGVTVACGYPGTPSTEILEAVSQYKDDIYCEWAPNEKVALEVAAGASLAGARCIVTMKHVGLNVAADPLMTLSYIGTEGGLVICVADDPGMHSSQNEQDTRNYARFAKIPIFEPSDSQEAKEFVGMALEVSEKFRTPVILRSTTRISHSRSLVEMRERMELDREIAFIKDPPRHVPIPVWGRVMRKNVEDRLGRMQEEACQSPANRVELRDRDLGIITSGMAYQYVREVFPNASVLKLGWSYPFPDDLMCAFNDEVEDVLVVEEGDDMLEQRAWVVGLCPEGRAFVPGIGELSTSVLHMARQEMETEFSGPVEVDENDYYPLTSCRPVAEAEDLPGRPPVLCPGCPHRGIFYGLGKYDVVVTGDIGCYSLGVFPPLNRTDVILCMGGGVTLAHGIQKAGEKRKAVGIVGDSTFFHSGVTGLMDIAYNGGSSTIIVVDNRTTAMTGHQDHPGTGRTLMGTDAPVLSIEDIGKVCGIKRVRTVNPYDIDETIRVLGEEIEADEASLIVSRAPCPLHERKRLGEVREIIPEKCKNCRLCLKLGCPAIEAGKEHPTMNPHLCAGCGQCQQVCKFGAIVESEE